MKKVWIEDGCTACTLCEGICPEVFEVTDIAHVKEGIDVNSLEDSIKNAAADCPVEVIKYE